MYNNNNNNNNNENGSFISIYLEKLKDLISDYIQSCILYGLTLVVPFLKLLTIFYVMVFISMLFTYITYNSILPKSILNEPIYFDYSLSPPIARIYLSSQEKQWEYIKTKNNKGSNTIPFNTEYINDDDISPIVAMEDKRFLKSGSIYFIDSKFVLAKSPRNFDIGKFMIHSTLFDSSGAAVAKSARPVVMPYQSPLSLSLLSYCTFPMRFIGGVLGIGGRGIDDGETAYVHVTLMNNYKEPVLVFPSTNYIELTLSSSIFDISEVFLTVMPELKGITYYVYYYPTMSIIVFILSGITVQLWIASIIFLVSIKYKYYIC
jgi:hypothetical protein